jgi:hypothetical protein
MTTTMVWKEEEEHPAAEECVHEEKKLWHKELDFEMLMAQEVWELRVLPGCSRQLQALLRACHPWHMVDWDAFLFEWDMQEDMELTAQEV